MELPDKCPDSVLAHIHKKQLNVFGMITLLPGNVLYLLAQNILLTEYFKIEYWFIDVRQLCS